ncbi:6-phosphogluconolactonase [Candidimonas sp. SYP-B2681]|uniref:6-phosphogluconolactonase n=1 Tax=Candidimonas sp. SYP-B2681 TaxID=2497686 RepID=UPI000F877FDE|nr:6-phosphogluconolactonase [Candidimonas sp. SYP-B2681]RTZ44537.1 6-phosphogluconolactonase [Candidimonas sp. SYP-B2681]
MWHEFCNQETYLTTLVTDVSQFLKETVLVQGRAGLAVSGGKSPIPLFQRLSQTDIPWEKICITLVDERFVPPEHPESNEYLVRKFLLINRARRATFSGLASDSTSLESCVMQANSQNHKVDMAILGMGDDGHTASLFPAAAQLKRALDVHLQDHYIHISPPAAPHERISMTLTALLSTQRLILAIAGSEKRAIFEQAAQQGSPAMPISYLITQTGVPFDAYWHA